MRAPCACWPGPHRRRRAHRADMALADRLATFDDVVKLTLYAIDLSPEVMGPAVEAILKARESLDITATPPLTGIGVNALASPEYLLELEAVAVLP